jgi:hypothetical protein
MRLAKTFTLGVLMLLLSCATAWSSPISIGGLDFSQINAAGTGTPGSVDLYMQNNTLPGFGAGVTDALTFSNVTLTVNGGTAVTLNDMVPGDLEIYSLITGFLIPDNITSFVFSATIGSAPLVLTLTDGTQELFSQNIGASYVAPAGQTLNTAFDATGTTFGATFDIFAVPEPASAVPEPGTLVLLGLGLGGAWLAKRRRG